MTRQPYTRNCSEVPLCPHDRPCGTPRCISRRSGSSTQSSSPYRPTYLYASLGCPVPVAISVLPLPDSLLYPCPLPYPCTLSIPVLLIYLLLLLHLDPLLPSLSHTHPLTCTCSLPFPRHLPLEIPLLCFTVNHLVRQHVRHVPN